MRKTNDTSKVAALRPLSDSRLDAVTGGTAQSVMNTTAGPPSAGDPTLAK